MNPHRMGPIPHEGGRVKQRKAKEHRGAAAFERVIPIVNAGEVPVGVAELDRASDSRGCLLNPTAHAVDISSTTTATVVAAHFHHNAVQARHFDGVLHVQVAAVLVARLFFVSCLLLESIAVACIRTRRSGRATKAVKLGGVGFEGGKLHVSGGGSDVRAARAELHLDYGLDNKNQQHAQRTTNEGMRQRA